MVVMKHPASIVAEGLSKRKIEIIYFLDRINILWSAPRKKISLSCHNLGNSRFIRYVLYGA
jgi:hypothetical protein